MAGPIRALVYAAGLGTRLAPLTDILPKPVLPIGGRPLVAWTLDRLAEFGCERAVLNLHHLGHEVRRALGDEHRGMPLVYSEEPEILGTLGALSAAREALTGAEQILLVNGDSLCHWPLEELLAVHRERHAAATLLFADAADPTHHGGGVPIDRTAGRVLFFPRATPNPPPEWSAAADRHAPPAVFAGLHVLQPELLDRAPHRFADTVLELYGPLLAAGWELAAVTTRQPWRDLGTPRDYLEGALAVASEDVVVCPGAEVAADAGLERCLVLPGARIGAGARLTDVLVGFDVAVPAGARYAQRLLARLGGSRPAGAIERGGLLEVPLDPGGRL
ncbi:MAG: sugar phosphate nucleotidyltransferase [Thermoanaerobaculia bacterium]|nr:sugar phosphate nucleotidyltransferase [Thermoanaerobaculia bacterium]